MENLKKIFLFIFVIIILQNCNCSLSGLGRRQEGDKVLYEEYYQTRETIKPENHTLYLEVLTNNPVTLIEFRTSTYLTTSRVNYNDTIITNIVFTAYNTTKFSLVMTVYGFGYEKINKHKIKYLQTEQTDTTNNDDDYNINDNNDIVDDDDNIGYDPYLANLFLRQKLQTTTTTVTTEFFISDYNSNLKLKLNKTITVFTFILIIFYL